MLERRKTEGWEEGDGGESAILGIRHVVMNNSDKSRSSQGIQSSVGDKKKNKVSTVCEIVVSVHEKIKPRFGHEVGILGSRNFRPSGQGRPL